MCDSDSDDDGFIWNKIDDSSDSENEDNRYGWGRTSGVRDFSDKDKGFNWAKLATFAGIALGTAIVASNAYDATKKMSEEHEIKQQHQKWASGSSEYASSSRTATTGSTQPPHKCQVCEISDISGFQKLSCSCYIHEKCFNKLGKRCVVAEHK